MAVEIRIISADGTVRTVDGNQSIELQAGETLLIVPDAQTTVTPSKDGDNLVLAIGDASWVVEGFYESTESTPNTVPKAVAFQDVDGLKLITPDSETVFGSYTLPSVEQTSLPESGELPEQFQFSDSPSRAAALENIFDDEQQGDGSPQARSFQSNNLTDPIQQDAGLSGNEGPSLNADQSFSVLESAGAGGSVGTVLATDPDGDSLTYAIVGGNDDGLFSINPSTGAISIGNPTNLDFETNPSVTLTISVTDPDGESDTGDVQISILDANDAPVFTGPTTLAVDENSVAGTVVGTVGATDEDVPADNLSFAIVGGTGSTDFVIDPVSGQITVAPGASLDRESDASLTVDVRVTDDGSPAQSTTQTVTINLNGINEFTPTITSGTLFSIPEESTAIATLTATDADLPPETLTFSIAGTGPDDALFTITPGGVLSFIAPPSFETPGDVGADNMYNLDVQVSDGANSSVQSIQVNVTDINDPPVFTSSATPGVPENTTAVITVTTTDDDSPPATYAITGGADAGLFSIVPATGVLTFVGAPDFEAPGDADANNIYEVEVTADDGAGATAVQVLNVSVTPVNDNNPVITSGAAFAVDENIAAVTTVTATDADLPPETLTFSIAGTGADDALFSMTPGGALSFTGAPDFETPLDAGADNIYNVDVEVSDGVNTAVQSIAVTVNPVNDNSPVFTSGAAFNVDENLTAVTTVTATDADVPADTVTFSIAGTGADDGAFSITSGGLLSFTSAPDFEAPGDVGADNVYNVDVVASDGTNTTVQSIAVTVDPVNDNSPVFTSGTAFNIFENNTPVTTVTATDADLPPETLTFSIAGTGADDALFTITAGGALSFITGPDFEAPGDVGADNVYNVDVEVSDGTNTAVQSIAVTVDDIGPTMITSGNSFNVDENTAAVTTVTAASEGAITYSIAGTGADDALFMINPTSGALSFIGAPDFETPIDTGGTPGDNVYVVDIIADGDDGGGPGSAGTDTQTISVTVNPLNDNSPVFTSSATFNVNENTTAVATVTATDADVPADTLTFSIAGTGADDALFNITSGGVLSFAAAPDFEAPGDVGTDNVYNVDVEVSDGTNTTIQSIAVTVDPVNDNSPVFTSGTAFNVNENTTAVTTVTATDADLPGDTLTFSIAGTGADDAAFNITSGGVLTFASAPDFEAPTDVGTNNVYNVDVRVSDGTNTTIQSIAVTVDPVNDNSPTFTSGTAFNVNEETTAVTTVTATDADLPAETLTFSLAGGVDAGSFSITSGGVLSFSSAPDFELPGDVGGDNVYNVNVRVSDGINSAIQSIAVTVDPVNDNSPVFTSGTAFNVNENTTAVTTVTATDADLPGDTLTFSIAGGADGGDFNITSGGVLTFASAPDFEAPGDVGADNVYNVDVRVSDGANTTIQSIAVTVDPVNDNSPVFTSGTAFNIFENNTAVTTVTATDADLPAETLTFSIAGSGADDALFTITAGGALSFLAAPDFESPGDVGADNVYNVDVEVTDGTNTAVQSIAVTVDDIGPTMITSGNSFNVNENTAAVTTVAATSEGTITYSIAGTGADDALFMINPTSGALSFIGAPDFETPLDTGGTPGDNVYVVDVIADGDDGGGPGSAGTDTQTISVTVDPLNDNNPIFTSGTAFNVNENTTAVTTVTATDADLPAETLTFSIAGTGADDALFNITSGGVLSFAAAPDFEAPGDVGTDNVYNVDVEVSDGTNTTIQSIAVTVDPVNDNSPVFTSGTAFNVNENTTAVTTVTATDADLPGDTLTFSIAGTGADDAAFNITSGGVLTFASAPDFEAPTDVGTNNVYNVDVRVSDGTNTTIQSIAVTVDPVNDNSPTFTSGTAFNVNEETTAVTTVTATDADLPAETLTFSLAGGVDAGSFSITSGGVLSFSSAPDFELPGDVGGDNVYNVNVRVSDGINSAIQSIAVTVDPVNDNSPVFTSGTAFNVNENTTAVTTVTATDADLPGDTLTFSIAGGADGGDFNITSGGVLTFASAPDFEAPGDVSADNVYNVDVRVSDGANTTIQSIAVTVDPVNDNSPSFTSGTAFNVDENTTAVTTVTAFDADLPAETLMFTIAGGVDAGSFNISSGGVLTFDSAPDFELPGDTGGDNVYNVDVRVSDGTNTAVQSIAVTVDPVNDNAPVFTSGTAFNIDENTTAITTVTATDADIPADTVTFSIDGSGADDALFSITSGGVLSFSGAPDFETPLDAGTNNIYNVNVRASDGTNTTIQSIAVTVDPVNEAPDVTAPASIGAVTTSVNLNSTMTVSDPDAETGDFTYTISSDDSASSITFSTTTGLTSVSGNGTPSVTLVGSLADLTNALSNDITYTFTVDSTLTVTIDDGGSSGSGGAMNDMETINVNFNAPPVLGGINGDTLNYTEDDGEQLIDQGSNASLSDSDSPSFDGGALTVSITSGGDTGEDVLGIDTSGSVSVGGSTVSVSGVAIGTIRAGATGVGEDLIIDFDQAIGNATISRIRTLIRAISYENTDTVDPTNTSRNVAFTVTDGDGGTSNTENAAINVSDLNDAPVATGSIPDLNSVDEDAGAPSGAVGTLVSSLVDLVGGGGANNVTDGDGPGLGIAVTAVDTSLGTWHYSTDGGANWFSLGSPSLTSARLLAADSDTRIYLDPDGSPTGTISDAITFRIWDQTTGTEGSTDNVSTDTNNQFSTTNSTADITINTVGGGGPVVTFNTTTLDGNNGFLLFAAATGDQAGAAVSGIGDFNGDGLGDFIVGAPINGSGSTGGGQASIIFGTGSPSSLHLDSLGGMSGSDGFELDGASSNAATGTAVAGGGDTNGDGLADAFVGTPGFILSPQGEGALVFGRSGSIGGLDNFDVQNFNPTSGSFPTNGGMVLDGPSSPTGEANGRLGGSLDSNGDFNGDGLADMLIAAQNANPGGSSVNQQGITFLVFGKSTGITNVDPLSSSVSGSTGFNVNGGSAGDQSGSSVAFAGDVDGDGFDDFLVGAPGANGDVGEVYLIWGRSSGFPDDLDLSALTLADGVTFSGVDLDGRLGAHVTALGDINGDGLGDFGFSAPRANPRAETEASGRTYIILGNTNRSTLNTINLATLNGTTGFMLEGGEIQGGFFPPIFSGNPIVEGAGDVNGDGYDDILVGSQNWVNQLSGQVYIVYGHGGSFAAEDGINVSTDLNGTNGFTILGSSTTNGDRFGASAGGGFDFDGDGYEDLVIGAPTDNSAGSAAVILGDNFRDDSTSGESLSATGAGQSLVGSQSADTIDANGFNNVSMSGGRGNDTFQMNGGETGLRLNGGTGTDVLQILGSGATLDLTAIPNNRISNLEQIDLTGSGNNTLTADILDILALSETSNTLEVFGNAGDTVNISSTIGSWADGGATGGVRTYTNGEATLLVDDVITQVIT